MLTGFSGLGNINTVIVHVANKIILADDSVRDDICKKKKSIKSNQMQISPSNLATYLLESPPTCMFPLIHHFTHSGISTLHLIDSAGTAYTKTKDTLHKLKVDVAQS